MNFRLLSRAAEIAEEMGIPSTFVETNCSWCVDDTVTRSKLEALRSRGLKGILVSVNPFYAEFVPFERTQRCIQIGGEVFGRNLFVYQEEFYRQFRQLKITDTISLEKYLKLTGGPQALQSRVELFLMGRAAATLKEWLPTYPAQAFDGVPCRPSFLRSWHNHFDNYGHFMPGFCAGLSLGNWLQLDALLREGLDLEAHPILGFLAEEDMGGLFLFAVRHGYQERPGGYTSKCDLCLDIRSYLVKVREFSELRPREFYRQLEQESL
jgi:hypothetical protein